VRALVVPPTALCVSLYGVDRAGVPQTTRAPELFVCLDGSTYAAGESKFVQVS
jgi:hypothetical protein